MDAPSIKKHIWDPERISAYPTDQKSVFRHAVNDNEAASLGLPLFGTFWCESERDDLNWCRHTGYPFASLELILSGKVEYLSEGVVETAGPGEVYVLTYGRDVRYVPKEPTRKIYIILDGTLIGLLMNELGFSRNGVIHLGEPADFERRFREIGALMELRSEEARFQVSAKLWLLLLELSRELRSTGSFQALPPGIRLRKLKFTKQDQTPLKNREIARDLGIPDGSLYKVFTKYCGESPHRWYRRQRLERAALLLRTTDKRVSEIAVLCGFVNPKYFMTLFKRIYGSSPRAYRRQETGAPPETSASP
ncbi:MAG: helix-turn-helix transcriptional regulator [Lentisphaeria bacterium]|nr:helix-turn-helix transcriptional regulator [Lentisphaeria bacterium]